jgi:rfaE bifunctional protein nucleotidyltransferase chain/domain
MPPSMMMSVWFEGIKESEEYFQSQIFKKVLDCIKQNPNSKQFTSGGRDSMQISRSILALVCQEARLSGKKIVFTNGCFDILHSGHVTYLEAAKKLGDVLIIGLNTDSSVRRLKGESRPVNTESDRAIVVGALKSVDYVVLFDEETPLELIRLLTPDVLVKGGDYTPETIVGAEVVQENGGSVVVIPLVAGKSTTAIIQKAQADCTQSL